MIHRYLDETLAAKYGGSIVYEPDPLAAATLIGQTLARQRESLGLVAVN
ncbi:MAG: hypothetical protein LBR11_04745 [Deltaproteobacteria bacterium]|nr:hypothetical protein [Deltaproteobacteria bacterium]